MTLYETRLEQFRDAQRLNDQACRIERFCQQGPNAGKPGPCPRQDGSSKPKASAQAGGAPAALPPKPRGLHPEVREARSAEITARKRLKDVEKIMVPHQKRVRAAHKELKAATAAHEKAVASGKPDRIAKAADKLGTAKRFVRVAEGEQYDVQHGLYFPTLSKHQAALSNLERAHQKHGVQPRPATPKKSGGQQDHEAVKKRVLEVHRLATDPKTTLEGIDKALEGVKNMPGKHLDDLMSQMSINPKLHPTKAKKANAIRQRIRSRKGTWDRADA